MVFPFLAIIGMILYLYLTWRNLKDSYRVDNLITFSWLSLLVFLVGGRIIYGLASGGEWESFNDWIMFYRKPGINLSGGYIALLILTTWLIPKYEWKLWPFLEDMVNNIMILVWGMWLGGVDFSKVGWGEGIIMAIFVFCLWISAWIKNKYRSFVWYKSGKKGFRFFFTNMIFFLLLSIYFLVIRQKIFFGVLLSSGLINLIGLFILGEVFVSLLVNTRRKGI